MESNALFVRGAIIGGLVPALLYGVSMCLYKSAVGRGITTGWVLILIGIGVIIVGLLFLTEDVTRPSFHAMLPAVAMGMCSAGALAFIGVGFKEYNMPMAVLTPLTGLNNLIGVLGGLVLFKEEINKPNVAGGALLSLLAIYFIAQPPRQ